jgi:hypothetical protein
MSRMVIGLAAAPALALLLPLAWGSAGTKGGALYEGAKHKYHARLKIDPAAKTATVDILDGRARKLVPIKAKTIHMRVKGLDAAIVLTAVPRKEAPGTATRYVGKHDRLAAKVEYADVVLDINPDGKKVHRFTLEAD